MRYHPFAAAVAALLTAGTAQAGFVIVDVIPSSMSSETEQNSEPNIGVNPLNPNEAIISAFGTKTVNPSFSLNNPYFATANGGATWTQFDKLVHADTTLDYSPSGTAYMGRLTFDGNIQAFSSANPPGKTPWAPIVTSSISNDLDQPWLVTGRGVNPQDGTTKDRIYVAFNDVTGIKFGQPGPGTATVRLSTDGGASFSNVVIDKGTPGVGEDDPAIRLAVNGNRVYAAFTRWNLTQLNNNSGFVFDSEIVVVRDDAGGTGATKFGALGASGAGVTAAITQTPFTGTVDGPLSLGKERIGAGVSIAVDPKNPDRVLLAFSEVPGAAASGQMRVRVMESLDGGQSWTTKFVTTTDLNHRQALPSIAVSADGSVGLQYTAYDHITNKLEQHFLVTSDDFVTHTDSILERFTNGNVPLDITPYLGDYMDLVAVGNTFYGAFSSSNNLNDAEFLSGAPLLQRDFIGDPSDGTFLLGSGSAPVNFSIDPFFFAFNPSGDVVVAVPEPASLVLFGVGMTVLAAARRGIRSRHRETR
jgi:hypothetical protein